MRLLHSGDCNDCGQKFYRQQYLQSHFLYMHAKICEEKRELKGKLRVVCSVCGNLFIFKQVLDRHLQSIHSDKICNRIPSGSVPSTVW